MRMVWGAPADKAADALKLATVLFTASCAVIVVAKGEPTVCGVLMAFHAKWSSGPQGAIVRLKDCVENAPSPPATFTVKFEVPVIVGVPLITPATPNFRPVGRLPETTDHV